MYYVRPGALHSHFFVCAFVARFVFTISLAYLAANTVYEVQWWLDFADLLRQLAMLQTVAAVAVLEE